MNTIEWHEQLRAPFPKNVVGKLPKGGIQLDYVGHAAVTDRLLSVDPEWSWEPLATDDHGLPLLDKEGNLWIRLTIHGHTRLGVGDGRSMKERIGDAIRNGAMRFGVALDLWSKDELESAGSFQEQAPVHVPGPLVSEEDTQAWLDSVGAVTDLDGLRALWKDAQAQGALDHVPGLRKALTERSTALQKAA